MKLMGDEGGIAQLKAMHAKDANYLKFLVGEAKTNTDMKTTFRGEDGSRYELRLDLKSGDMIVSKA